MHKRSTYFDGRIRLLDAASNGACSHTHDACSQKKIYPKQYNPSILGFRLPALNVCQTPAADARNGRVIGQRLPKRPKTKPIINFPKSIPEACASSPDWLSTQVSPYCTV